MDALDVAGEEFGVVEAAFGAHGEVDGAAVLVIYDDGTGVGPMQLVDGSDYANSYINPEPPLDSTTPQMFSFEPAAMERTAQLVLLVGDAVPERTDIVLIEVEGAQILIGSVSSGVTAVLHTWTRTLRFHPHLHCVVTVGMFLGGGFISDWLGVQVWLVIGGLICVVASIVMLLTPSVRNLESHGHAVQAARDAEPERSG